MGNMIDRDVARKAMADYHWNRYASREEGGTLSSPAVFSSHTWQDVQDIIDALPAVTMRVKPLVKQLAVSNELGKALEEDAGQQRERAERLEAALREAAHAWATFKGATISDEHFHAVERLDAALKGADHD